MPADWTKYSASQRSGWLHVNRVAGVEFVIMPILMEALRQHAITPLGQEYLVPKGLATAPQNFLELHEADYSLSFMRMGSFIRLGTVLETFLRDYYMEKMGIANRTALRNAHPRELLVFQRALPRRNGSGGFDVPHVVTFFLTNLRFDIRDNSHFASVQEVFAHRHLFAHQGGVVDAQYLDHIEAVLGMPERQRVEARVLAEAQVQRLEDAEVLWFEPLNKRFAHLIEESKRFILGMPQ